LEREKRCRREADGEIIKLRAAINGVKLNDSEVDALLPPVEEEEIPETVQEEAVAKLGTASTTATAPAAPQTTEPPPEVTGAEPPNAPQQQSQSQQPKTAKDEDEETKKLKKEAITPEVLTALGKLGIAGAKDHKLFSNEEKKEEAKPPPPKRHTILRQSSDYFPLVRRGTHMLATATGMEPVSEDPQNEELAMGWKTEVTNRKEREEALRDDVRRFEIRMKRFYSNMEDGVDVVMWQLNKNAQDEDVKKMEDNFSLKASSMQVKLQKRGDTLLQAVITFKSKGGYLSKAFGKATKSAIDPLSLGEVLEVNAGCVGFHHLDLPASATSSAGKSKSKIKKKDPANRHLSTFLTLRAAPTPVATTRLYIIRFKSRSARNDLLNGLRALLGDLQIREGVGISSIHASKATRASISASRDVHKRKQAAAKDAPIEKPGDVPLVEEIMIPLADVHKAINKERKMYDRLLLMLLQNGNDTKRKEDELIALQQKLESVQAESAQKDKTQANDSKLIMQLSKKLETLLMDNEDLRDQNDRLNTRLVQVECEKMNLMSV